RHVLFILPSIIIIATLGWYIINYFLSKWIHISFKKIGVVVGFICLIEPVSFIVSTFPFTNTYYNFFVGGTAQAFGNYEMDSYGNSLKPVSDWFIKNVVPTLPKNKETVVATNYPQILNIYLDPAKDSNLKNIRIVYVRPTEKNNAYWDYCIMHSVVNMPLDQLKYNAWVPQHYLYEAKVKGKTLCVLYKRPSFDDLKGFEYMNKNNGDSALYYFTNYLKFEPKDITILNSISNIYLSLNQTSKADSFIQLTLSIDPGDYTANYIIGLSRLRQNKFAEAIENFKLIVAQSPYNFDASYYLGVCYYQTRDLRSAYESFSNVLGGQYQEASAKYLNEIEPQLP
ncbi:MAG: hypothetical protein ORN85_05350, partial [Sediminibacterium sp.]|nr:hypothetical protein [Sediminibacterium sp.]